MKEEESTVNATFKYNWKVRHDYDTNKDQILDSKIAVFGFACWYDSSDEIMYKASRFLH